MNKSIAYIQKNMQISKQQALISFNLAKIQMSTARQISGKTLQGSINYIIVNLEGMDPGINSHAMYNIIVLKNTIKIRECSLR